MDRIDYGAVHTVGQGHTHSCVYYVERCINVQLMFIDSNGPVVESRQTQRWTVIGTELTRIVTVVLITMASHLHKAL